MIFADNRAPRLELPLPPGGVERMVLVTLDRTAVATSVALSSTAPLWGVGAGTLAVHHFAAMDATTRNVVGIGGMVVAPLAIAAFAYGVERAHIVLRTNRHRRDGEADRVILRDTMAEANGARSRLPVMAASFAAFDAGALAGGFAATEVLSTPAALVLGVGGFAAVWKLCAKRVERNLNRVTARRLRVGEAAPTP